MKVAIIGNNGKLENTYYKNIKELFLECGYNTGNLVYWYAVDSHIKAEKEYFGWQPDVEYINNNFDYLIFVASNQLNPNWDMSVLAELFSKLKIPLIIIGLGVQFNNTKINNIKFKEGTEKFIKEIKDKAIFVSVRGEITAEVLNLYKVKNIVITGCPSNFINRNKNFISDYFQVLNNIERILVNMNFDKKFKKLFYHIFNLMKGYPLKFIIQDNEDIVSLCREKNIFNKKNVIKYLSNLFGISFNETDFFVKNNFEVFFNADAWLEYVRKFSLSIGTRMHGNMIAFQSGVPSLFLTHDVRLSELVKTMKLPYIEIEKFYQCKNINGIKENINFSINEYYKRRSQLLKNYLYIFKKTNIDYDNKLELIL